MPRLLVGCVALLTAAPRLANGQQKKCDWSIFGSGSAAVNQACCSLPGEKCVQGLPLACSPACAAKYIPFHAQCDDFIAANMRQQVPTFAKIMKMCTAANGAAAGGDASCAARLSKVEQRMSVMPVSFWLGDGKVFVGRNTSAEFFPCTPVFLYDAGRNNNPMDCMNGLRGVKDVQLDANHDYPLTPVNGCPPNPITGPGGGWKEAPPKNGKHYFANVLSGDTGGFNSWGVDDDTSDGGQFQTFHHELNRARVKEAFNFGWVMRARAKLVRCTTVSTYLFSFTGKGERGWRYLPYICNDNVAEIGNPKRRNKGGIAVGEYLRPGASLPPDQFKKNEYHLYELVYDPKNAEDANKKEHGIDCKRCTAQLYVDGVDFGLYYPYYFDDATMKKQTGGVVRFGSGSSAGQSHLRWNWVEFAILTPECRQPYYFADAVPTDALVYLDASQSKSYPGTGVKWYNLAFRDSAAVFQKPVGFNKQGGSLVFHADTDAGIDVDALGFTYTEDFSVELAVKPGKQQQAYAGLFGDHNCGGHQYTGMVMQQIGRQTNIYYFAYGAGKLGWSDGNGRGPSPPIKLQAGKWQHVVLSASRKAKKIITYVNGKQIAVMPYIVPVKQCPKGTKLEIGDGWAANDSRRWNGEMRKFALYTEPKTAAEVAQMYRVFQEGDGNSDCLTAKQSGVVGKVICDATTKGGGWTLLAKIADKGNAWHYNSKLWTTDNVLNPHDLTLGNSDAKYLAFNTERYSEWLAVWPDFKGKKVWHIGPFPRMTALEFFNTFRILTDSPTKDTENWIPDYFSTQAGRHRFSINHDLHGKKNAHKASVRWGYSWNNEMHWGSDDVAGGIGLEWSRSKTHVSSAGDIYDCCGHKAPAPGIARKNDDAAYRVLIYGRHKPTAEH